MRNRVKEVRTVKASELRRNQRNWRLHPENQRNALRSIMDEVGFVGTLVARETKDGLELIDGHLRADVADTAEVPVAIVDLDDREAALVLATYDPLGEMALVDQDELTALLAAIDVDENAEIRRLVSDMSRQLAREEIDDPDAKREVEGMALQPHEHYDYLVVLATTTHEWNVLCDRVGLKPTVLRRGRMGTCRAMRAGELLKVLNATLHDRGPKPEAGPQHADHPEPAAERPDLRRRKRVEKLRLGSTA